VLGCSRFVLGGPKALKAERKSEARLLEALRVVKEEYLAEPAANTDEANEVIVSILCELSVVVVHHGNKANAKKYLNDAEAHMKSVSLTIDKFMKRSTTETYRRAKSLVATIKGNSGKKKTVKGNSGMKESFELIQQMIESAKSATPVNYANLVDLLINYSAVAMQANDHDKFLDAMRQIVEVSRIDPTNLKRDPDWIKAGMKCICGRKNCEGTKLMQEIRKISLS